MYDKFRANEPIWSLANQLALAKVRTESFKEEYHSKGLEEDIKIGREEGVEIGKKK